MARGFKSIVVINGGDLWESDQINSAQTVKGTILNDVDMVQGIRDAKRFYDEVITCAVANSEHVDVYTTMGNHSGDLEYLFIDALSDRFPQIDVHNTDKYRQAFLLDEVGIMIGHGDRTNKKLPMLFATEFTDIWSKAKHREIMYGHWHFQKDIDDYGCITRQLGTPKPTNK